VATERRSAARAAIAMPTTEAPPMRWILFVFLPVPGDYKGERERETNRRIEERLARVGVIWVLLISSSSRFGCYISIYMQLGYSAALVDSSSAPSPPPPPPPAPAPARKGGSGSDSGREAAEQHGRTTGSGSLVPPSRPRSPGLSLSLLLKSLEENSSPGDRATEKLPRSLTRQA
jgi:hypothetical protein